MEELEKLPWTYIHKFDLDLKFIICNENDKDHLRNELFFFGAKWLMFIPVQILVSCNGRIAYPY